MRDMLLGAVSKDLDLVSDLPHAELIAMGFRLVEAKSATTIYFRHCHRIGRIEVTRLERLTEIEEELARRDFTINAMAMDLYGLLIDPLEGRNDLRTRQLRPCGRQAFTADPLRIFRAFRFACHGWQLTKECEILIRERDWHTSFTAIPVERFSAEMLKGLSGSMPERFFRCMLEFSAGGGFLPELFSMARIPAGPPQHHPEGNLFTHSIQVLQRVSGQTDNPLARFCAIFHDIGKLATDPALYPEHCGHEEAGFDLARQMCNRMRLPSGYRRALAWISRLHGKANKWAELRDSTRLKLAAQALQAGIVEILPLVSAADKLGGKIMTGWDLALAAASANSSGLGIDPVQLAAMPIENRGGFIMQKRVELLRLMRSQQGSVDTPPELHAPKEHHGP